MKIKIMKLSLKVQMLLDTIYNIFNHFEITSITPTDKEGENQVQDELNLI